jgi:hypothetical protein
VYPKRIRIIQYVLVAVSVDDLMVVSVRRQCVKKLHPVKCLYQQEHRFLSEILFEPIDSYLIVTVFIFFRNLYCQTLPELNVPALVLLYTAADSEV